jgi:hypothetical protein
MRSRLLLALVVALWLGACKSDGDQSEGASQAPPTPTAQGEASAAGQEGGAPEATRAGQPEPQTAQALYEGRRNGRFESERFNLRFTLPGDWQLASGQSSDSLTFEGPGGIQMVVANSQSIQLVDGNFSQLNDRVSFESVNVLPDRTQSGPVNGMPAYRVEGDALLRGENQPIYFISQAVNVPGQPVMVTIFIPGDNYFEHSDTMHAVLDSIEALDLRPTQ